MKAAVFHRPGKITVDNVEDPQIEHPQDVILKVTATAICGSDLHMLNGYIPQARPMTMGHEFMGIVEEVGNEISNLKVGDRVVVPFPIACGNCHFCHELLPGHCEHSNEKKYGPEGGILTEKGGGMFGYSDLYGGYNGGQAEYVRVPYAQFGPRIVPAELKDEEALFLTDIFPTGYSAIDWSQMKGGETVVVFGCGPVGLMAMKSAWLKGASRVIGVDFLEYRLAAARQHAQAETINANDEDLIEKIRSMTNGRGADVAVDAVGLEAKRSLLEKAANIIHAQVGSINALRMAISAVRRGGVVTTVGVYAIPYDNFPLGQIFDKGLTLRFGQAPVHKYIDQLMKLVVERKLKLDDIITHRMPLLQASEGYDLFNNKEDNCVKVVLIP